MNSLIDQILRINKLFIAFAENPLGAMVEKFVFVLSQQI